MTTAVPPKPTWAVYECDNRECDVCGERWPVRGSEEVNERRCPECGYFGHKLYEKDAA